MLRSAGILAYRNQAGEKEFFLVHPGGPFFRNKDEGAWSIPKGLIVPEEFPLLAAQREFFEETGIKLAGNFIPLSPVKLKSGKVIEAWAIEYDFDERLLKSNEFSMEWPPRSGKQQNFPEVDRGGWFKLSEAKKKINAGQLGLIEQIK